jgi:hypothetical protein
MLPDPLQMIALMQVALGRWARAILVLIVPPLVVDAAFLFVTLLFFRLFPLGIVPYVAYVGGLVLIGFASRYSREAPFNTEHPGIRRTRDVGNPRSCRSRAT